MLHTEGTPFVGYVSLSNTTPAAAIPIYVIAGAGTAYTLATPGNGNNGERIVLYGFTVSSNDTAQPLVQITDQATSPKIVASVYAVNTQPTAPVALPAGMVLGQFGVNLKAIASAVTAAKTVEVTIYGIISRT